MPSGIYDNFKTIIYSNGTQGTPATALDLTTTDKLRFVLTDDDFLATETTVNQLTSELGGSRSAFLKNVTIAAGKIDADDMTGANQAWASTTAGTATALVLFYDSGTDTTSPMIAYLDIGSTALGSSIDITFNANGIIQF